LPRVVGSLRRRVVGDADQRKLYALIWRRTLASQMRPAEIERTTADIAVNAPGRDITLRAVGSVVTFPGFLAVYGVEAKSDKDSDEDDEDSRELPPLAVGDSPRLDEALIEQHFTQPPPRYTEASLIKKMEELGIGRPSTYAATISVLQDRNYVRLEKRALVPEDRGRIVTAFLENFFTKLVEYGFTAGTAINVVTLGGTMDALLPKRGPGHGLGRCHGGRDRAGGTARRRHRR